MAACKPVWLLVSFVCVVLLNLLAAEVLGSTEGDAVFDQGNGEAEHLLAEPSVLSESEGSAVSGYENVVKNKVDKLDDHEAPKIDFPPSSLLHHLAINLITFATVLVPGYLIRARYLARRGTTYEASGTSI